MLTIFAMHSVKDYVPSLIGVPISSALLSLVLTSLHGPFCPFV